MILGVFIEFFGVKIAIGLSKNHCDLILTIGFDLSQNSQYIADILPIFYRYISDIYRYFIDIFSEILAHVHVIYILYISSKYKKFPIFHQNIGDFY